MATSRSIINQETPSFLRRHSSRLRSSFAGRSSLGSPLDLSSWRSPFPSSRNQSLSQSFQNLQVIAQTQNYVAESYGTILPVLVTEALTTSERHVTISVKMIDSGWAWLVCGKRLFVWKYLHQQSDTCRANTTYCRELTLPPSDLAHKTELVNILPNKSSQAPSALSVSPEGIVRYWANIAHEGASFQTTIDLQGQECFSLSNVEPLGCILATTTSSLVQLVPTIINGQNTVLCRTLRLPHGMFAEIGRRMSSFIFGTVPNQSLECKQLSRVLCEDGSSEQERLIYVLTGNNLQKWKIEGIDNETLTHDVDLERSLTPLFVTSSESQSSTAHDDRPKVRAVDMQLVGNGRILVFAESSHSTGSQAEYAFATIECDGRPSSFCKLKHFNVELQDELNISSYQLLVSDTSSQIAYVFNDRNILCVSVVTGELELIQFPTVHEKILGAGFCQKLALFFVSTHGIISVVKNDAAIQSSSILEKTMEESVAGAYTDDTSKLKMALVLYYRNELAESQLLINEFLGNCEQLPCANSVLDKTVEKLSRQMIDDHPGSDPRWAESVPSIIPESSVIVLHHLAGKLRAHDLLVKFLKVTGLWKDLYMVKVYNETVPTATLIRENAEKLKAAMALKGLENRHGKIITAAIHKATAKRMIPQGLTHKDVFYQEVSLISDIFLPLFQVEQEWLCSESDAVNVITNVNSVFLEIIRAIGNYRQTTEEMYESETLSESNYGLWTSTDSLRAVFKNQHRLTAEHISEDSFDLLCQQLFDLTDFILTSYQHRLLSLSFPTSEYSSMEQEYKRERNRILHILMGKGQMERAVSLAEKYCDFDVLIELCEKLDNRDRLQRYMIQFSDQNFASYVFKWYMNEGKCGKLLSFSHHELSHFLKSHDSLSWLHHMNIGEFELARNTLKSLALNEKQFLSKKKTLLSLAKLTALISSDEVKETEINEINNEQNLLLYQETLPTPVLDSYGLDADSMRVLSPEELIEMYISESNEEANEYDFKKALDLAHNSESLQLHIWCQAILRDSWNDLDTDEPFESLRNTLFFRVIDLAFTQNVNFRSFLPSIESILNSEELSTFSHNPNFIYLLKASYEYIEKLVG